HDAAIRPADLVVESIVEDLAVKQQLFTELEMLAGPAAVLCSNTSGLRISDIARRMHRPQRAFTTHFWNPPHLVPLVEIVLGEQSDAVLAQKVRELLQRCEKRPVIVRKDVPGQLGNRLQHALIREALFMLEDGIASAEDIEEALKAGPGLRWPVYGPFEHSDLVGLDLTRAVQASVLPALARNTDPAQLLGRLLEQGKSGARSGEGIYSWRPGDVARVVARRDAFLVEQLRRSRTGDEERT
ncbi:MAG: 3-hydroxyacyl-CoA dehydrogenase NAD-binding domain-containing protein, partial [Chloroflexi bacterium]|nr:3-hydroxyacyl-CoA dehydrogenase NAD-binding domain-containing protein [Chloroflexota bacterium]